MPQTASNDIDRHEISCWRAAAASVVLGAATVSLGRVGWHLAATAVTLDARVAMVVLGLGALAGALLTVGTGLLAAAAAARAAGRTARAVELASTRLTPRVLRRVLVAGLGAGLAGFGGPALADSPPDLGWQVTEQVGQAQLAVPGDLPPGGTPAAAVPALASARAVEPEPAPDPAPPAPDSAPDPVATRAAQPAPDTVLVNRGDCLWSIAAAHLPAGSPDSQIAAAWPRWYAANRATIGADPDLILPGQRLTVPDEAAS